MHLFRCKLKHRNYLGDSSIKAHRSSSSVEFFCVESMESSSSFHEICSTNYDFVSIHIDPKFQHNWVYRKNRRALSVHLAGEDSSYGSWRRHGGTGHAGNEKKSLDTGSQDWGGCQ